MNSIKSLRKRIRGWMPQEPLLLKNLTAPQANSKQQNNPSNTHQYDETTWFIFRFVIGALLIAFGGVAIVCNEFVVEGLKSDYMWVYGFVNSLLEIIQFLGILAISFLAGIALLTCYVKRETITKFLRNNWSIKRMIPYVTAAGLFILSYVVSTSGIQIGYAVPITLIVTGILAIKGLKHLAVTIPAYTILIISMLFLGCMIGGMSTTTYVPENRYITNTEAPNTDTINLGIRSVFGEVRVYFSDDPSTVCHVAFIKEYGPVYCSRSNGYHSKTYYETEPASSFNYTAENRQVSISTWSRSTLVNVTINRGYKANLTINDYMGDIVIYLPSGENPIQTTNYTTTYGSVRVINP